MVKQASGCINSLTYSDLLETTMRKHQLQRIYYLNQMKNWNCNEIEADELTCSVLQVKGTTLDNLSHWSGDPGASKDFIRTIDIEFVLIWDISMVICIDRAKNPSHNHVPHKLLNKRKYLYQILGFIIEKEKANNEKASAWKCWIIKAHQKDRALLYKHTHYDFPLKENNYLQVNCAVFILYKTDDGVKVNQQTWEIVFPFIAICEGKNCWRQLDNIME